MRVAGWISALFVSAFALSAGVGYVSHRASGDVALSAGGTPLTAVFGDPSGLRVDPPHVVSPPSTSPSSRPSAPSTGGSAPAGLRPPSILAGSQQLVLINRDRASRGLGPLSWSGCLYNVAVANARRIAAQGYLSHTSGPSADLRCGLGSTAGENIGSWSLGINDAQLNSMFMNSPDHYANIMGPFHYAATAWVVAANGHGYIAVEFS